jgi:NAD-dependent dihydropyrimidine dehydrogenase PreA subunit
MAVGNEVYNDIAQKLGVPPSKRVTTILEAYFSPQEGEVVLQLFEPTTCQEVASRMGVDEKKVFPILENLTARDVIKKGKTQYCFHSNITAFHHHTVGGVGIEPTPEKIKKAWGDFFFNEWSDLIVQNYIKRQAATGRPVFRVWPAMAALDLSPNIKPEQILRQENFRLKLQNTPRIVVGRCGCRKNWARCDHPVEACFAPLQGKGAILNLLGQPGRTSIREISLEEALAILRRSEEAGLVNTGACFCCTCSCEILFSLKKANRFDLLGKSRYQATVNEDKCTGCQDCLEKCPFDAVEMKKVSGSKKMKASILADKCMGCGVCIVGCKQRALTYEVVRPPEYIINPAPEAAEVGVFCKCGQVK